MYIPIWCIHCNKKETCTASKFTQSIKLDNQKIVNEEVSPMFRVDFQLTVEALAEVTLRKCAIVNWNCLK